MPAINVGNPYDGKFTYTGVPTTAQSLLSFTGAEPLSFSMTFMIQIYVYSNMYVDLSVSNLAVDVIKSHPGNA
jgi:hypothetical protein